MRVIFSYSCLVLCVLARLTSASEPVSFRSDIAPILLDNCLACHGPKKAEGGYRVDSYDELLKPGDSGEAPIATMSEQVSELLRRIASQDESERMPAETEGLTPMQIELVRSWIAGGAKFDGETRSLPLSLVIPPLRYADPPESYSRAIPMTAAVFSPDGTQVVAGGYHEVTIWNVGDASLIRRIKNMGQRVFALAFSPDGKTLAVACGEPGRSGEVRLVNFEAGEVRGVIGRSNDVALDVAFRPGTNEVAIASADGFIRLIDTDTLEEIRVIASHADWVTAVAWSDDGSRLASASRDKSAKVYDGSSGELLSSYLGHGAAVRGVAILADGKQVVSTGADGKLHRWNIEAAKKIAEIGLGGEGFKLIRGQNILFVPCTDRRLLSIDLSKNAISHEYIGHADWVLSAALQSTASADVNNRQLVSGSFDGQLRLWNTMDGSLIQAWLAKP